MPEPARVPPPPADAAGADLAPPLDALDRRLVEATQAGLALVPRPYHALGEQLGIEAGEVIERLRRLLERGVIRRIGVVANHYRLGWTANAMTVWDVDDAEVAALGARIGELDFVSHCYRRPRHPPAWPYNLFAMVHGRDRAETDAKVRSIEALLGEHRRSHAVLYSTRILKKTGLRLRPANAPPAPAQRPASGG